MVLSVLIGIGEALIQELEIRFLAHGAMDVIGIVYPNTGYSWNVMQHLSNTFKVLNQFFT
jgi:hypothetical protein